jgi:predicted signal transduction protein with EAL and GGDEF domain
MLVHVAKLLERTVREEDFVARVGGDEFVVTFTELADQDEAERCCERIHTLLDEPIEIDGIALCVRGSIGIALAPAHGVTTDELLQHADVAMYVAKGSGAASCTYAPELDHYSPERLRIAAGLRGALADGQIRAVFQPKLDLRSDRVLGVEALVRWYHPERGVVPPIEFLPVIENTELIGPLTWEVLDQSLAACAAWRAEGIDLQVAVNLSARTVSDPTLVDHVRAALEKHGLPASSLELELTESAVLGDHATAGAILAQLRTLGVTLAVDDFGTGYASISYLTTLPLDVLKIDRSFVMGLLDDPTSAAVAGFTLDLSRHLGLHVVAEGIEDQPTLDELRRRGCDSAQGFLIARPMPPEEIASWVRSWDADARAQALADLRVA